MPPAIEHLAPLLTEVAACTLCSEHLPLGPRPLLKITPETRILIVGQAPGRLAHTSGIPWDDPSGIRLRSWLGVSDETFYEAPEIGLMPMGFCYPGTGKGGDMAPRPECAPAWHERLFKQMPKLELTLLIGRFAQTAYLPPPIPKTLTATVKDWESYAPEYLPLPHPSPRNNRWLKQNPWFASEVLPFLASATAQLVAS